MLRDVVIIGEGMMRREDLFAQGLRAARGFDAMGWGEGDAVALLMRNDFPFFEASRGASTIGVYPVPLNWHNKSDEIAYVLADSKPRAIVAHADILLGVADAIPPGMEVFLVPTEGNTPDTCPALAEARRAFPHARVWTEWVAGFAPWDQPPRPPREAILYTSGTTGRPKAVRKPAMNADQLAQFVKFQRLVFGIGPGTRALVLGPLYHAMPDASGRAAVNEADIAVLLPRFDAETVLKLIDEHKITHVAMVPTHFVRLLKLPEEVRRKYDMSSLRKVSHTGGPCPPEVKRQMIDWWGPIIGDVYGGTEMGVTFFASSEDWLRHPGTVGRPLEGTRYAIVGPEGQDLPPGEVGEIYARNAAYGDFTYVGRDDDRRACERDGLITIGDVGYVNADGYLFLCDRKRDMVISGGVNIYPAETESVLLTHPEVQDCAVFGIPDDEMGETLIAAVQPRPGASPDAEALRDFLRARLTGYKVPKRIEFHASLPREDSGKIFKRKLRDPYWQGRTRQI
ncbi:AMP-binding protein [Ruixingdingia sedimenti]|uniref:AMP-binding protein n=1 Tax=Ruixingdingia sedimenti TaxID=3073604 RepID=A0ABU1F9V8_9RHOB|nr:AMP-binding protein [Xinfangfangia sp. LG-4]MDR5653650.1 AMP-binding protein [Xinfangfangia sp. LG-4]